MYRCVKFMARVSPSATRTALFTRIFVLCCRAVSGSEASRRREQGEGRGRKPGLRCFRVSFCPSYVWCGAAIRLYSMRHSLCCPSLPCAPLPLFSLLFPPLPLLFPLRSFVTFFVFRLCFTSPTCLLLSPSLWNPPPSPCQVVWSLIHLVESNSLSVTASATGD